MNPDMSGVIALANAFPDMGAMTKLDLRSNDMCAEGIKLIVGALKGNQVMTELNISSNYAGKVSKYAAADMSGIIVLAEVIKDMRALSILSLKENELYAEGGKALAASWPQRQPRDH
jgi:hypothetical protein